MNISKSVILIYVGFLANPIYSEECDSKILSDVYSSKSTKRIILNCSATFKKNSVITAPLWFEGKEGSNSTIDCNNSTLLNGARIRSNKVNVNGNYVWQRPENVTIKNCNIKGGVRVSGIKEIGVVLHEDLVLSSRFAGHTLRAQKSAPKNISILNSTIEAIGGVPFYIDAGVTGFKLENSTILGHSEKEGIYLDAETSSAVIRNNIFRIHTGRPLIAIDGSANNIIEGNQILGKRNGGILIYRNCGEKGLVRHQAPMNNTIKENYFDNNFKQARPDIWIGSRDRKEDHESFCWQDKNLEDIKDIADSFDTRFKDLPADIQMRVIASKNYGVGSSKINSDMAKDNIVTGNTTSLPIRYSNSQNIIKNNIAPFEISCHVSGNSDGCMRKFICPENKKIKAIKVACNLETTFISDVRFKNQKVNTINIQKESKGHSSCEVNQIGLNTGSTSVENLLGQSSLKIQCHDTEKDGGDCAVRAGIICE